MRCMFKCTISVAVMLWVEHRERALGRRNSTAISDARSAAAFSLWHRCHFHGELRQIRLPVPSRRPFESHLAPVIGTDPMPQYFRSGFAVLCMLLISTQVPAQAIQWLREV